MEGLTPKQRNHIQAMQCPWGGLVVLIFLTYSHKIKKKPLEVLLVFGNVIHYQKPRILHDSAEKSNAMAD